MSCYHPLAAIPDHFDFEKNKWQGGLHFIKNPPDYYDENIIYVPCGKCIGCRLDYSRKWADRMMLELDSWNGKAIFLTLTYDNRHLVDKDGVLLNKCRCPDEICNDKCFWSPCCMRKDGSLYKRHLQLFMKRFRKFYQDKYGLKCRFYAVGEYGDIRNTHRPHYHLILFGVDFDIIPNKKEVRTNELKQKSYTSTFLSDHWDHGNISFSRVSWNTCAYVARYVTKKALDPSDDLLIETMSINPIFSVMSRKPGIGAFYLDDHPDCLEKTNVYISTPDGARKIYIPKYFVTKLQSTDEEQYDRIIAQRMLYAKDSMFNKLAKTDIPMMDYLEIEEKEMMEKVKTLKRYI